MDLQKQLCDAIRSDNLRQVEALLRTGANPNRYPKELQSSSPMADAAARGFLRALKVLHGHGGDVNLRSDDGGTPLIMAALMGQSKVGQWLLLHGADVHAQTSNQHTALSIALDNHCLAFADMLLHARSELRERGLTEAAQLVIAGRDLAVAQWLLQEGVSPNLIDKQGFPWLMVAQTQSAKISEPLTSLLLAAGANVNLRGPQGATALHLAQKLWEPVSFMKLLHAGANPDLATEEGFTVRMLLESEGPHDLREPFLAWEASCKAHQTINASHSSSRLKPL